MFKHLCVVFFDFLYLAVSLSILPSLCCSGFFALFKLHGLMGAVALGSYVNALTGYTVLLFQYSHYFPFLSLSLSLVTRKHTHTLKNTFHMDTKHCRILFLFFSLPSVTRPLLRNQVKAISKLINREERNTQGPLET